MGFRYRYHVFLSSCYFLEFIIDKPSIYIFVGFKIDGLESRMVYSIMFLNHNLMGSNNPIYIYILDMYIWLISWKSIYEWMMRAYPCFLKPLFGYLLILFRQELHRLGRHFFKIDTFLRMDN